MQNTFIFLFTLNLPYLNLIRLFSINRSRVRLSSRRFCFIIGQLDVIIYARTYCNYNANWPYILAVDNDIESDYFYVKYFHIAYVSMSARPKEKPTVLFELVIIVN